MKYRVVIIMEQNDGDGWDEDNADYSNIIQTFDKEEDAAALITRIKKELKK